MAEIRDTLILEDRMSQSLNRISESMATNARKSELLQQQTAFLDQKFTRQIQVIDDLKNSLEKLNSAPIDDKSQRQIDRLTKSLQNAQLGLGRVQMATANNMHAQDRLANSTANLVRKKAELEYQIERSRFSLVRFFSTKGGESIKASLTDIAAGFWLIQQAMGGIKKVTELADDMINMNARARLMNETFGEQIDIQDEVFKAAQRSRGGYMELFGAVTKMGILAKDAFGSQQEVVAFTELMQKSFRIGGSSAREQAMAMYQLTQAMGSGRLQGDEFRSIIENAPMLAKYIAKAISPTASIGDLKKLSAEGKITADVMKNALFQAGEEINKTFNTLPRTFADISQNLRNEALRMSSGIVVAMNRIVNTEKFLRFVDVIKNGMELFANIFIVSFETFVNVGSSAFDFLIAHSETVISVMQGVGVAISVVATKMVIAWTIAHAPVILLISGISLISYALTKMGVTSQHVLGGVAVFFGLLGTTVYNVYAQMHNAFASLAEFFMNVFDDPLNSILRLFVDVFIGIVGVVERSIGTIGKLIGKDLTKNLRDFKTEMENVRDGTYSAGSIRIPRKEAIEYEAGVAKAAFLANSFDEGMRAQLNKIRNPLEDMNVPLPVEVKNDITIDKDSLKYINEAAMLKYQVKYQELTPSVTVQMHIENVNENVDVDHLADSVAGKMIEVRNQSLLLG